VRRHVADGSLRVFATSGGQQWFRLRDVEAIVSSNTNNEKEN
jgi:hypothetical protein